MNDEKRCIDCENTCAIFVLYDETGMIDEYVYYLLRELKTVSKRIIIVSNSNIDTKSYEKLKNITEEIILRENRGFDAEAYRTIILNYLSEAEIKQYDKIIFCNDTFYGPFISFKEIFEVMEAKDSDFWGLHFWDLEMIKGVTSSLLVFNKRITNENLLIEFFKQMLEVRNYNEAVINYEHSIFEFLVKKGMTYALYCEQVNIDVYRNAYHTVKEFGLPSMKRKCLNRKNYDKKIIMSTLKYIDENTDYPIELIIDSAREKYYIELRLEDVRNYKIENEIEQTIKLYRGKIKEKTQIEAFMDMFSNVYLYTEGHYTQVFLMKFPEYSDKIKGIIVSDGYKNNESFYGYKIFEYSEFLENKNDNCGIIVTTRLYNEYGLKKILGNSENVLYLWDDVSSNKR